MPTGADVAGTYSILSLILSLCLLSLSRFPVFFLSFSPFFFFFYTRWIDALLQNLSLGITMLRVM